MDRPNWAPVGVHVDHPRAARGVEDFLETPDDVGPRATRYPGSGGVGRAD